MATDPIKFDHPLLGQSAETLAAWDRHHLWHPFTQMAEYPGPDGPLVIVEGDGARVRTADGRWLLDGYAQMWCGVWGHRAPHIDDAIKAQLGRIAHSTLFSATNPPSVVLARLLSEACDASFGAGCLPHCFLSDNGSTAVEVALKLALQYHRNRGEHQRRLFVAFDEGYHGDTIAPVSLGGVELFRRAYEPLTFEVLRAPYPMCARPDSPSSLAVAGDLERALTDLRALFTQHGAIIAGAVIEPGVQGAAGMRPLAPGFLRALRTCCDQSGALLIADEVFSGLGRCGHWFASARESVTPDLLCLAKGLTAGYLPAAATMATANVFGAFSGRREEFRHLFHGHTYTGNQLACVAACANLVAMRERDLLGHIASLAPTLAAGLDAIEKLEGVGPVRQVGLAIGVPLLSRAKLDCAPEGEPAAAESEGYGSTLGARVCRHALRRGLLTRPLGNVVVLAPPLAVSHDDLAEMLEILKLAVAEVAAGG